MESDEDKWMYKFHERAEREQEETRDLRERVQRLTVQVEEGDAMRRENEMLRAEKERREREGRQYEQEVDEFKQSVLNNFPPRRGRRAIDDVEVDIKRTWAVVLAMNRNVQQNDLARLDKKHRQGT